MPQDKLQRWYEERTQWLKEHPQPISEEEFADYQRLFPNRLEQWLDGGYGECLLHKDGVSEIVERALRHFDGDRYTLGEFVVMPNHVHVLATPLGENALPDILHSWKSYTAHEINRVLLRTGPVWQEEYFDHLVRDAHSLECFAAYIAQNPIVGRASRPPGPDVIRGRDARTTN